MNLAELDDDVLIEAFERPDAESEEALALLAEINRRA
jgi:hypothetical protein